MLLRGSLRARAWRAATPAPKSSWSRLVSRTLTITAFAASAAVLVQRSEAGTTETWTGNTSTDWNTATNWSTAVPVAGDDVILTAPTGKSAPSNQNSATVALNSVTLTTASDTTTFNNGYSISGTTIGLASGGILRDNAQNLVADTINTGLSLNGPASIVVSSGSTGLTVAGGVSGTGPLSTQNNAGPGKLILLGSASYTGGTNITAGTLQLGNGAVAGAITGAVAISSGATLVFDNPSASGLSGASGQGNVDQIGAGKLTIGIGNTYSGTTTIGSGSEIDVGSGGSISNTSGILDDGTFLFASGTAETIAAPISGSGTVKTQASFLTLTGANSWSGGTNIVSGTLQIGNATTAASMSAAGDITDNGALIFNNLTGAQILSGNVTGNGSLEVDGGNSAANLVILTGAANGWTGGTVINAGGTLQVGTVATGSTIAGSGAITDNGTLTFNKLTAPLSISGAISGTGQLNVGDPSNVGPAVSVTLTHDDSASFTGNTHIATGSTLQIGDNTNAGGIGGNITDNGLLDFHNVGGTATFGGKIIGSGAVQVDSGADVILTNSNSIWTAGTTIASGGTLEIGNGGTSGLINGAITDNGTLVLNESGPLALSSNISGTGGLNQDGSGTTTLVGTTTYLGLTSVNAGSLVLTNGALGGDAFVATGANLTFQNSPPGPPGTISYGGAITGGGSVSQNGNGTLIFTGTGNTYSGGTTIGGTSTLQIGDATHAGSLPLAGGVTDNGVLSFVNLGGGTTTISGNITGAGKVDVNLTSGTVALTGTNTYSGGTTIEGGTLAVASTANIGGGTGGPVSFANGATLQFTASSSFSQAATLGTGGGTFDTNGNNVTWGGIIGGGANGLTKAGTGTFILTASENYTGDTTVSGGILQLGNGATNGNLAGNIVDNATVDFDETGAQIYSGTISSTGVVEQIGTGTLTLSGTNTYSGGTNITAGTLSVSSDANLGNGGTVAMSAGTTLKITATGTFAHDVTLTGDPTFNVASGTTTTWSGLISDGASAGTLEVSGGGTFKPTNVANSYSGGTAVHHNSIIVIDASGELGAATGGVTLGNATTRGTLDVAANMTLEATRPVSIAAGGGTIQTESGVTFKIGQGIGGAGPLTVSGPGTFILAGTSTYAGGTTVSNGATLQLGDGATSATISGGVTDNGALVFDQAAASTFSGLISGTGALTQNAANTLTLNNTNTYTGGTTIAAGTLQLGDGTTAGSVTGPILDNATLAFNEPSTVTILGAITGTGGLTQNGPGTVILTGANTYGGPTLIAAASTLQIGSGSATGSITGTGGITDNGTLAVNESGTVVIASAIGGTGGVSQIGTGTTALTGANTYAGPTTISAGTLSIGNGGSTGSLNPNSAVSDAGTLAFNETGTLAFANAVSGTGGIAQQGPGTTIITGALTNSGPISISAGTLQVGSGGTAGSLGSGTISDGGTLAFNHSDTVTLSSPIGGGGALVQMGPGKLILTGANSFTGGTTISGGSLQIGSGGTSGALTGNVSDATNLAFNRSDTLEYDGAISGTGSVSQIGTGTTVLNGANTYTGGTTISAGTLQIGNGGASGSIVGNVADAGALVFNRTGALAFNGIISGTGSVTQAGVGSTTFAGTQTYTGSTAVTGGTLVVTGSIAASHNLTVSGGGTIAGTGILPATTLQNGGTISPGTTSTGTLSVTGNLILGPGSTYAALVTPTSADLIKVSGTAVATGTLTVTPTGSNFPTTPVAILTASGGLSGKFTSFNVIAPPANQIPILTYDADDAFLNFIPSISSLLPPSAKNTNESRVASAIDFALSHDGAADFTPITGLSGAALTQVLAEMSGEEGVAFQGVAVDAMRTFLDVLTDPSIGGRTSLGGGTGLTQTADASAYERLAYNGPDSDVPVEHGSSRALKLWATGYGFQNTTDANALVGTHKTTATQMGGEVGLDYRPDYGNGALGIALGISGNRWDLATNLGKGQSTAYQVGAYYSRQFDGNYLTTALSYAFYNNSTTRTVHLAGTNLYHAAFDANSEAATAEFGHVFTLESGQLSPYLRLAAQDLGVGKYAETTVSGSPSFALSYTGKQYFDYTSELGAAFTTVVDQTGDAATALHARLGWLHDFVDKLSSTATFAAFPGASFTVNGAPPPPDSAHLVLGIEHDMDQFALSLNGEGAFAGSAKTYGGTASVSYRW